MRPLALLCALLVSAAVPAAARRPATPPRPRLAATADTNSAVDYYGYGVERLQDHADDAAAAFHWASRLEPTYADALYARHVAALIANPARLLWWWEGDRSVLGTAEVRAIDSLRQRAQFADPLVRRNLGDLLVEKVIEFRVLREYGGRVSGAGLQFDVRRYLDGSTDPVVRGQVAYGRGDLPDAVRLWGAALRADPRLFRPCAERGIVFAAMGNLDSARANLQAANAESRRADTATVRHVYDSKESLEYTLGRVFELAGSLDSARAAYQRALEEKLGFFPAHVCLAQVALAGRDTVSALTELERALAIRDDDYESRLTLGFLLGSGGRFAEAIPHLARAAEAEPWAAAPVDLLGQIHDAAGHRAEALEAYQRFLRLSRQTDPGRAPVEQRVAALRGQD